MKKFEIPEIPTTTYKGIRFPDNVIEDVENMIRGKECTFTAFVIEATKVALENIKREERKNATNKKTRKTTSKSI